MNVVFLIFIFLSIVMISSAVIINSWIKFADRQIDRRQNNLYQKKIVNELSDHIKHLNKNLTSQKKIKNSNIVIDVECEIVEEINPQTKYLYLDKS